MKMYNIKKAFTCIQTKQSENNPHLMESPTFANNGQNSAKQQTNKETIVLHDLPPSLIEMNKEDKKRLADTLIRQFIEDQILNVC